MNRRAFCKGLAALVLIPNTMMTGIAKAKAARKPLMFGRVLNVPVPVYDENVLLYCVKTGSRLKPSAVAAWNSVIDGDVLTVHTWPSDVTARKILGTLG